MVRLVSFALAVPTLLLASFGSARADTPALGTVRVAHGLDQPVYVAAPPNDPRLFVVERAGIVREIGALGGDSWLDISDRVDGEGEGGLLSLTFPPDFAESGAFYVYYTHGQRSVAGDLESRLSRFRVSDADSDRADPDSETILLRVAQPFVNHNGGTVAFGPDGFLYLGLGDGGLANDSLEVAQDGSKLLGKLLRLDVRFTSFRDGYAIPADNPFVGDPRVREEIWALGLRNPFRFSFDRNTGDLYIGDVGQGAVEEVDVEPAPDPGAAEPRNPGGRNYGWDVMEGSVCFEAPDPGEPACGDPALTFPVFEYGHDGGNCSVTGGRVYRGSIPAIQGHYFFADFCSARIASFQWDGAQGLLGSAVDRTAQLAPDLGSIDRVVAFGEDAAGELYIVDLDGEVFQLVPEPCESLFAGIAAGLVFARFARRSSVASSRERFSS